MRSLGRELSMDAMEERELEEEDEGGKHKWTEFCSEFAWNNIWFKHKVFRGWTDIGENIVIGLFFALLSLFDVGSDSWSAWRLQDTTFSLFNFVMFSSARKSYCVDAPLYMIQQARNFLTFSLGTTPGSVSQYSLQTPTS